MSTHIGIVFSTAVDEEGPYIDRSQVQAFALDVVRQLRSAYKREFVVSDIVIVDEHNTPPPVSPEEWNELETVLKGDPDAFGAVTSQAEADAEREAFARAVAEAAKAELEAEREDAAEDSDEVDTYVINPYDDDSFEPVQ